MSTTAALIRYDRSLDRRVAGLDLLTRAVLVLGRTQLRAIGVLTAPEDRDHLSARLSGGRLKGLPLVVLEAPPGQEAEVVAAWRGDRALLVIEGPVALDPAWVEAALSRLAHREAALGSVGLLDDRIRLVPAGADWQGESRERVPADALPGTAVLVADRAAARRARRALLAQSIKPLEIDGVVCWLLVRRLSVRLSALLLSLPVTPNQVTLLSILVGLGAALAVGVGDWPWPVLGGALLFFSLVLDNCDGEIARVKLQGSTFGAWLDIYGDFVVNAAFMAGMAVGAYRVFAVEAYLWAGGFALFAFTFYNAVVFRYIHRLGIPDEFLFKWWFDLEAEAAAAQEHPAGEPPTGGSGEADKAPAGDGGPSLLGRFLSGLKYLGRRDFFIFAYFVTAALGVLHWAFWATVAGAALNFFMMVYQVFFWKGSQRAPA